MVFNFIYISYFYILCVALESQYHVWIDALPSKTKELGLETISTPRINNSAALGKAVQKRPKKIPRKRRKKRYDYEDKHEWPPGDTLEYELEDDYEFKEEELSFWQKAARNWQVVFLRLMFIVSIFCVFCGVCCFLCYINCRVTCHACLNSLMPWRVCIQWMRMCYEDPNFRRAKEIAEVLGIKLDYSTYMRIYETHEAGGRLGFNPHETDVETIDD